MTFTSDCILANVCTCFATEHESMSYWTYSRQYYSITILEVWPKLPLVGIQCMLTHYRMNCFSVEVTF